jgi:ADP-ribose pyrophosphatase YjhB (NUDIX family)
MKPDRIRVIAICVFRNGNRILAAEYYDAVTQKLFRRPLGGTVEFGERSEASVIREMREEIDAEITKLRYLGTLENIFVYEGQKGHEIVQVYDARFVEENLYNKEIIQGVEQSAPLRAVWVDWKNPSPDGVPLYPSTLPGLLEKNEDAA